MSENLAKFAKHVQRQSKKDRQMGTPDQERKALSTLRVEARRNGATLKSNGEGGLSSVLVLQRMRAAHYRCENKHCPDPKKALDLDHRSGHPREIFDNPEAWANPKLRAAVLKSNGPKDDKFVSVLCARCHACVHDRERALEAGEVPKPMPGQKKENAE